MRYWRSGRTTNNQTLFAFNNGATTGWRLILGNDRSSNLFYNGLLINFSPNNYMGMNHMLVGKDSSGALYFSLNGSVGATFAAPGAYTAAGASAITSIGADKSSASFAATQTSMLQHYVLDGVSLTPAQMGDLTNDKNALDRWHASPLVTGHAALVWLLNWEAWDGSAGTFAGTGSGAITLTKNGTGGTKSTMGAFDRYRIPKNAIDCNAKWDYYERGALHRDTFAAVKFSSNAADTTDGPAGLTVDCYGKNLGIVGNAAAGVSVNGTNLAGNNVGGAEMSAFDVTESIDVPGIVAGAAKPFVITETIQSLVTATGEIKPNASPQFIRVPHGSTLVFGNAFAAPPADCDVYLSDSLLLEQLGLTDIAGVKGPCYEAAVPLQRAANPTKRVALIGEGGDTWFNNIGTAAKITALVAHIKRMCIGTSTNTVRAQMGTNDYGGAGGTSTYSSMATFKSNLADFFTALFAAGITGLKLQLIGTTDRTNGGTANAAGFVLADFRTAQSDAIATYANANATYTSFATTVSSGNKPDGLHYNAAGHLEWSNQATATHP